MSEDVGNNSDTDSEESPDTTGSPQSSPRMLSFPASSPIVSPLTSPTVQPSPCTSEVLPSTVSKSSLSDSSAGPSPKRRKTKVSLFVSSVCEEY